MVIKGNGCVGLFTGANGVLVVLPDSKLEIVGVEERSCRDVHVGTRFTPPVFTKPLQAEKPINTKMLAMDRNRDILSFLPHKPPLWMEKEHK